MGGDDAGHGVSEAHGRSEPEVPVGSLPRYRTRDEIYEDGMLNATKSPH